MTGEKERDLEVLTEALMWQAEADGLIKAPAHFKQEVLQKTKRLDRQLLAKSHQASTNVQLLFYSLKIGAAMVTALFLLFAIPREFPRGGFLEDAVVLERQEESLNERLNTGLQELNQILKNAIHYKQE